MLVRFVGDIAAVRNQETNPRSKAAVGKMVARLAV